MHVRKAVILAAGYGTRFLPATKAVPKEMLPLVDRPAIQHVVEEAVRAGLQQIIMVTAGAKRAVEDHFDREFELDPMACQPTEPAQQSVQLPSRKTGWRSSADKHRLHRQFGPARIIVKFAQYRVQERADRALRRHDRVEIAVAA